jgi:hypothetical protein
MLGEHRLLEEQRGVRLERAGEPLGHRAVHAAVEVDGHVEPGGARRRQAVGRLLDPRLGVEVVQLGGGVHLHGGQAGGGGLLGRGGDVPRPVAPDPAVHAHPIPGPAAEQLPGRHAERAALDVPQRLLDPGDRAAQHRPAAVEAAAPHDLEVVLDAERVAPSDLLAELLDRGAHGGDAALDDRLTPAHDALVGRELEEQPARRYGEELEPGDAHLVVSDGCTRLSGVRMPIRDH